MSIARSLLFNFLFYFIWTPLICIGLLPSLLFPRKVVVAIATLYQNGAYYLEKYILGLDYEIRGAEHKPKDGQSCLIASKHYSAYETLILFRLFKDPAIILKKELLLLPVFGWFLKRLEVIAIDRGRRAEALSSLYAGANKVKGQNRPIVIFPQGTRVRVDATTTEKPYKSGLIKLYAATGMPISPMAINSGLYWPRNSFWKKSGKVIIEFLPMIPPGLPPDEVSKMVETQIETASSKLIQEGRQALTK